MVTDKKEKALVIHPLKFCWLPLEPVPKVQTFPISHEGLRTMLKLLADENFHNHGLRRQLPEKTMQHRFVLERLQAGAVTAGVIDDMVLVSSQSSSRLLPK